MKRHEMHSKFLRMAIVICALTLSLGVRGTALAAPEAMSNTQTLTTSQIEQVAEEFLAANLPPAGAGSEMVVEYRGQDVVLPEGALDFDMKITNKNSASGRFPLLMKISVDGVFKKGLWVTAQVKQYMEVIQARRPVKAGTVLSADDITLERALVDTSSGMLASRADDVIGYKIIHDLPAGTPIDMKTLVRVPLVARGDRVLIIAEKGGLRITTPGIVQDKGYRGSVIPVENIESKKVVYGEVLDATFVQVKF